MVYLHRAQFETALQNGPLNLGHQRIYLCNINWWKSYHIFCFIHLEWLYTLSYGPSVPNCLTLLFKQATELFFSYLYNIQKSCQAVHLFKYHTFSARRLKHTSYFASFLDHWGLLIAQGVIRPIIPLSLGLTSPLALMVLIITPLFETCAQNIDAGPTALFAVPYRCLLDHSTFWTTDIHLASK